MHYNISVPIHNLRSLIKVNYLWVSIEKRMALRSSCGVDISIMNRDVNEEKNYRPNVAAVIVSSSYPEKCEVFVAERSDIEGAWQFPQGGVDDNEQPREALLRELKEEIGTDAVDIIAEYPGWISYDFPDTVAKKMYPYDGQKQRYFLVRLKEGAEITLDTKVPEFSQYRFVEVGRIIEVVSHFKRAIYKRVLGHFKKTGYL